MLGAGNAGMQIGGAAAIAGGTGGAIGGAIGGEGIGAIPGAVAGAAPGVALLGVSSDVATGGQLIMDLSNSHSLGDLGHAFGVASIGFAGGRILSSIAPQLIPGWLDKAQQSLTRDLANAGATGAGQLLPSSGC